MRKPIFIISYVALGLLLCAVATAPAQQADEVVRFRITNPKLAPFRLAIPSPAGDAQAAHLLQEVLSNDLALSGLFKVLDPASFLPEPAGMDLGIDPDAWRQVNAEGVLKAQVRRQGNLVLVEFRLYQLIHGNSPDLAREISGSAGEARVLGHRAADAVVQYFTGARSFFGTRIAFSQAAPKGKELMVMDWDGARVHPVTNNGSINILPSWHPSGAGLLYTSFQRGAAQLFAMPSGGGLARIISARNGINTGGVYSPDGSKVALTLSRDGNSDIYLLNDKGDLIQRLTNSPFIDASPTWSPDGDRIAFVSNRHGSPQIWVMSQNGAGQTRLTRRGKYNQEPAWAPRMVGEQSLIAFCGRDDKGAYDIFTVNVDTQEVVRVTENRGSNTHPTWAPTARALAYASERGGIWVATADGKIERQVYAGRAEGPSWGPWLSLEK